MTVPVVCELPVLRWGVGSPASALLVHGIAANGAGWWRVASGLADAGLAVTAPDLRGHGAAPRAESYRFADFAADLARLGDSWDVVVGHSFAGPIVTELIRSGSVSVGAVVLVDPFFETEAGRFEALVADQAAEADPDADYRVIAAENPSWHTEDAFHKAAAARSVSSHTIDRAFRDNLPWDHSGLLAGLGVPVRILGADPEVFTLFPPELARRVCVADPLVSYTTVPGVGHGIHRERPEVVVAAAVESVRHSRYPRDAGR